MQPLREYFAGRYLYKTAPYSPQGLGRFGTKPDRFDALARNSYWTNVTRFFCGFYDVGELLTLVDGLLQLDEEPRFGLTNQTRQLAMMLLADHVFSQAPRAMKRLVAYVIREPGLRRLTAGAETQRAMALPQSAGGGIMFSAAKAQLQTETDPVRRGVFRRLMGRNASWETLKREWIERLGGNVMDCDPLWEAWDFGIVDRFSPTEIEVFGYRVRD